MQVRRAFHVANLLCTNSFSGCRSRIYEEHVTDVQLCVEASSMCRIWPIRISRAHLAAIWFPLQLAVSISRRCLQPFLVYSRAHNREWRGDSSRVPSPAQSPPKTTSQLAWTYVPWGSAAMHSCQFHFSSPCLVFCTGDNVCSIAEFL
jgi:hypothetical protein